MMAIGDGEVRLGAAEDGVARVCGGAWVALVGW